MKLPRIRLGFRLPALRVRLPDAWIAPLRARWETLPPHLRHYLKLGGWIAIPLVLYLSVWVPMQRDLNAMRARLPQAREQLALMRVQATQVGQLRSTTPTAGKVGNLSAFVEQLATTHGLKGNIKKLEPAGSTGVQLGVENVGFNALMSFLGDLQKQAAIAVENAAFDAHTSPGTVNAQLTLRTSGS
jgi:general secretion pathway protein M